MMKLQPQDLTDFERTVAAAAAVIFAQRVAAIPEGENVPIVELAAECSQDAFEVVNGVLAMTRAA